MRKRFKGVVLALAVGLVVAATAQSVSAAPLTVGDVLAGVGGGNIKEFTPTGTLVQTLVKGTTNPEDTGMCFRANGNLLATNFAAQSMSEFSSLTGALVGGFGSGFNADPESCAVDSAGNVYVGQADGTGDILKFNAAGTLLTSYNVAPTERGSDWIDLAADQATMFYASESPFIHRWNVATNTAMADFANAASGITDPNCFAVRIRPNGDVMVACSTKAYRFSAAGTLIQTYPIPGARELFALNLDPDNATFWTADITDPTGTIYHVNIATGAIINSFPSSPLIDVAGLAVVGELRVAVDGTPPICEIKQIVNGPPKKLIIKTQDLGSGLKSIVVNQSTNANTPVPAFTQGTTSEVDVTATKINQSLSSTIVLTVTDMNNNVIHCDPVFATVSVKHGGKPSQQTYTHLARAESKVQLINSKLGVRSIQLRVNGHLLKPVRLAPSQTRLVNVARWMRPGNHNKITVIARGALGSSATVLISD